MDEEGGREDTAGSTQGEDIRVTLQQIDRVEAESLEDIKVEAEEET